MKSKVLKSGTLRAVHVFVPALQARLKDGGTQPVWAVRSSLYGYRKMMMAARVEILGPSQGVEHFDMPLPGTSGRGVALIYTQAAIRVFFTGDKPEIIDVGETAVPASQPKHQPQPAPVPIEAPVTPVVASREGRGQEVWYTARSGRKSRYALVGYVRDGRVARLQHAEGYSFRVRADQITPV